MKQTYTREKRTLCGEGYMEVDLYPITPEEHAAKRRKKARPSSERQKKRERPSTPTGGGCRKPTQTLPCWAFT